MTQTQKTLIKELMEMQKKNPSIPLEVLVQVQRNEILFESLTDIDIKMGEIEYWMRGEKKI